jgi:putative tricarboxylic transport membrane protein
VPVENVPGAAGTIGLARFISAERGTPNVVLVSGLIMLGAIVTHRPPVTLREVTPLARLTGEYEAVVVSADSPFRSLDDLVRAFKARPESISWGGGSAGGTDQILAGLIADAVGVAPRRVNYIAFSGGGEALAAIVGGQVSVGINGLAEFEGQIAARTVRVLAVSSGERLPGVDAPTLIERGLNVELENWRSVVAPPGIDSSERARLARVIDAMVRTPSWRAALERYRWIDRYLPCGDFERFVESEERRVRAILRRLGTASDESAGGTPTGAYPLLVIAGLVLTAGAALVESRRVRTTAPPRASPRSLRPVALVGAGIALNLLLLQPAGFVLASTVLFWCTARAFDSGHPWRDLVFAAGVSVGCYLLFVHALELALPAGWY